MNEDKLAACYGPIGKTGWDALETEIERQCVGLTPLERYSAVFVIDFQTGELRRVQKREG